MSTHQPQKPTTITAAGKPVPKWGDPISSIPTERRTKLGELAERQQAWVAAALDGQRDLEQSAFKDIRLTGAEVFFLAALALAGPMQNVEEQANYLRAETWEDPHPLPDLHLERAVLIATHLEGANLYQAHLEGANLDDAHLEGAFLYRAYLERASLYRTHLERAVLIATHLEGANLRGAHLEGASLQGVSLSEATDLSDATLDDTPNLLLRVIFWLIRRRVWGPASLGDVKWHDADLTGVGVLPRRKLGDERGMDFFDFGGYDHRDAVRAYRQVAQRLRDQGMVEDADRLAYRAQVVQRRVLFWQDHFLRWLFSWILFLVAGYGYRPIRSVLWYLAVIVGFAFAYFQATHGLPIGPFHFSQASDIQPLPANEALILSVSSFHGRGFFQPVRSLGDPVAGIAAIEAVMGLFIEISFIATFTQRFFAR